MNVTWKAKGGRIDICRCRKAGLISAAGNDQRGWFPFVRMAEKKTKLKGCWNEGFTWMAGKRESTWEVGG